MLGLLVGLGLVIDSAQAGADPAAADVADEVPRFEEVCFGDFDDAVPYPGPEELRRVFTPVREESCVIHATTKRLAIGPREMTRIAGLFRLNHRWEPATTLRLSLVDPGLTEFYFWCGREGVHLRYCPAAVRSWGAYRITRRGDDPRPEVYEDWALDNGRYRRAGLGTFEIRWHGGRIVLTRGDVRLLSVPLPTPPEEVYFATDALVRGVSIYRSTGAPVLPEPSPTVMEIEKPAEAEWECEEVPGVRFEKLPEGPVRLSASSGAGAAQATIAVPGPGLFEYIFRLADPEPGTGVCLADAEGNQLARLAFYRDRTSGRTTFAYLGTELEETELEYDFERAIVPYAGREQWLRLTLGGGVMKAWTSGDGAAWSQAVWAPLPVEGAVARVGLYCVPAEGSRSIRLDSFALRRPAVLGSLVPDELIERAGSIGELGRAETLEAWDRLVRQRRPRDVAPGPWQRACILRTLAENPYFSLGGELIHRLLDDVLGEPGELTRQLKLLDEAAVLVHNLDEQGTEPFARHYERIGMRLLRQRHPDPLEALRPAILCTPVWNFQRQNAWPERLLYHEVLSRVEEERWDELELLLGRLRYWARPDRLEGGPPAWGAAAEGIVCWAERELARHRGGPPPATVGTTASRSGPALIETIDKETYNVLAELQAALAAGAVEEAAALVTRSARPELAGVLPDGNDPRLLVSLPVAVEAAVRRSASLQEVMQRGYAALGELRFAKAASAGDAGAVEAVAVQFPTTPAAAKAHAWLGDRALSLGRAAGAVGHYLRALRDPAGAREADCAARLRLAGALLGEDRGEPVTRPVHLGGQSTPAQEFEAMVTAIRKARRTGGAPDERQSAPTSETASRPRPDQYETRSWTRFSEARPHDDAAGESARNAGPNAAEWLGRRVAVSFDGERMFVSTGREVAAFDLETGRRTWSQRPAGKPANGNGGPAGSGFVPMRPVVASGRVLVRAVGDDGPKLACLDASDGSVRWVAGVSGDVAADPMLLGEELFVLVARPQTAKVMLLLMALDGRTGAVLREAPLAEFRDGAASWRECQAAAGEGRIVVTAAGCVLCCDTDGRLDWIRRQMYVPPPSPSPRRGSRGGIPWDDRRPTPPHVLDGRVYATQPGVWSVECIDLGTGRLVWRKAVPEIVEVLGACDGRLILRTWDTIVGMDLRSGDRQWLHHFESLPATACLRERAGVVACVGVAPPTGNRPEDPLVLVALDAATGAKRSASGIRGGASPGQAGTLLGPLVGRGERLWLFAGREDRLERCDVVELVP